MLSRNRLGALTSAVAACLLLAACGGGNDSSTAPAAIPIDGTWAASQQPVGSSLVLSLDTRIGVDTPDTLVVNGSGTYALEAGPSGTLTAYGSYRKTDLALQLTYDSGTTVTFAGSVNSATQIAAKLTYPNGSSLDTTFLKQ